MGDTPSSDQPLPEGMTWSAVANADGSEEYTMVTLPLTYHGPSIPLETDGPWMNGGLISRADPTDDPQNPAPTDDPLPIAPDPGTEPTTVFITVTEDPITVYITEPHPPPVTVTVVAPQPPTLAPPVASGNGNPSSSLSNSGSNASNPFSGITVITGSVSAIPGSMSTTRSTSSTTGAEPSVSSSGPSTTGTVTREPPNPAPGISSDGNTATDQTSSGTSTSNSPSSPALESSLPSVTGNARTYLGLAPDAFLGVVLAIVLSAIILLCCILCWIRHRRRRRRRQQQEALPPPTTEQASRLLAGDRDPTREDLAYPYSHREREYRRSQIAMMRARGELDDDWEDRLHSPSMRSASVRLPEDEVGTAYGIRERAFAAAGVYGYAAVPRDSPSFGAERDSIGDSTQVPTITPANAAVGAGSQSSPAPRKDTRSTEATASSALHLYAAGGRSRSDSNDIPDNNFFYNLTSEGEAPSPVASSADLHFLNRYSSQGAGGAAAIAAARAARRHAPSSGSASLDSNRGSPSDAPHTRNLEEVPRSAIAYPESPVSDDQEGSRLMAGGEAPVMIMTDTAPQHQSHSSRESGLSRWIHGGDRSARGSQQPPIFQRVLQRVMGNRLSTQPAFSIIPTSTTTHPQEHSHPAPNDRMPSRISQDFDFGNGLLFPRPPMHTGHSSGANTARDDPRWWGGILPSRVSPSEGVPSSGQGSRADVNALSQLEAGDRTAGRSLGAPIMANRDVMPQMKERASTPGSNPLLGTGLRPPPPSAFSPDRGTSTYSSGRSTVYYDARSATSTPSDTLGSGRDRAGSPLSRYDSPPPQPVTALRNVHSTQSLQSASSAPFLPPGLFVTPDDHLESEPTDALDMPPPMPTRDVRQARSLNTIFSVGTAETYDTANSPLSIGRAFQQDELARFPPPGIDPAPRISRSVPSDVGPSEAAEGDLGAGTVGSTGRGSGIWRPDHLATQVDDDILEDEPPMAASQWRVLSAYPYDDNGSMRGSMRGSLQGETTGSAAADQSNWRLTLGQPVTLIRPTDGSQRHSHLGDLDYAQQDTPTSVYDSQGSRGSSNRTNVSHSRDIHSLRASEGGVTGSNGSKGSNQTGTSHRSVSEHGHLKYPGKPSGGTGGALLSAFGPGPSRQARGTGGGAADSIEEPSGDIVSPAPRQGAFWWNDRNNSPQPARTRTPPSAPAVSTSTPGIRLVSSSAIAGTSGEGPSSAPVQSTRGWPSQGVPMDVTPADGRRPSQSHSFIHRESPLRSYSALHSHSPGPSLSHSHSPSGGGVREISRPGTSMSHTHSHQTHGTHGTHGAETTMGTMTEATTEDDHEQLQEPMPDMPLSDVEHILRSTSPVAGQKKVTEEEHGRGRIGGGGIAPPNTPEWFPRWQQL